MINLFIDTCTKYLILALYEDNDVIEYLQIEADNNLSVLLLPKIDELLKKANLKINDVDRIYVVNGPGSFTGIRIGVTTAKTIAYGLKKEICTVSELEVLASVDTEKKYIVPLIDARRNFVYTGIYKNNLELVLENKYVNFDEFYNNILNNYDINDILFVSNDNFNIKTEIPNINVWKVIEKHKNDVSINPHSVNPVYLKLTEAEEKLNDKRNN